MVTKAAPTRRTAGPVNPSRAAGAPAPASAAATAPGSGAYYSPGDEPEQRSPLAATFTETVLKDHVAVEAGGSADVEVVEYAAEEAFEDADDLAAEIARIRKIRKPIGAYTQKLALPQRLGYHRHWFNDVAGRIDDARANGWTHVLGTDKKPIARAVGTGRDKSSLYAFAMELPEVFWKEDQDARHAAAQSRVDALKAAPFRAPSGGAKASDKGKFYDPHEDGAPLKVTKV